MDGANSRAAGGRHAVAEEERRCGVYTMQLENLFLPKMIKGTPRYTKISPN